MLCYLLTCSVDLIQAAKFSWNPSIRQARNSNGWSLAIGSRINSRARWWLTSAARRGGTAPHWSSTSSTAARISGGSSITWNDRYVQIFGCKFFWFRFCANSWNFLLKSIVNLVECPAADPKSLSLECYQSASIITQFLPQHEGEIVFQIIAQTLTLKIIRWISRKVSSFFHVLIIISCIGRWTACSSENMVRMFVFIRIPQFIFVKSI